MSQSSDSRRKHKTPPQARPAQQDAQSSVRSGPLPSVGPAQAAAQKATEDATLPHPGPVTLDPVQFAALVDKVTENLRSIQLEVSSSFNSTVDKISASQSDQAAVNDPALVKNPLRDEHRKNIEAHRSKRWIAFWGISFVSFIFFGMLIFIFYQIISDDYLPVIIGAADKTWQWHILVFLGGALVLAAAVPLSLAMALVKMISDTDKGGNESSSDLKAPGIELAKAIIDLCKSVSSSLGK